METRRPISSKSDTCPESRDVNVAVISVEVSASYPGRAENPPCRGLLLSRDDGKGTQQSAEGIVGVAPHAEGPKRQQRDTADMSRDEAEAVTKAGMPSADGEGVRNTPSRLQAASNAPAVEDDSEPTGNNSDNELDVLMPRILTRQNMLAAYQAVKRNDGAPGVDNMRVEAMGAWLKENWEQLKADLLEGRYEPQPVRRVDIPKPGGGTRTLGIPTVCDRLIQQAIHQVLSPLWEEDFSEHSHGFRPGRSAHQAVQAARDHVGAGHRWVVDMDLEKFFDRVNHDILMARVARKVKDKHLLRLMRRYLEAGMMLGGIVETRTEGTPQGGPLSPLLSNILLDELDKELERRGHRFERYADDCNIYVKSKAAGQRVLEGVTRFVEKKRSSSCESTEPKAPWTGPGDASFWATA
jgi:RNA-directed DNA polymerase